MRPPGAAKVLVVEDESVLRASMVAGLGKLRDVNVVGAGTIAEAAACLDDVALVVSDIDLPDGLGVQIIGELAKRKNPAPIIFVTAYRTAYGSLIPPHAGVEVIEKPISLEALRQLVATRLGNDAPPSPFSVADYVQLACMGKHSVTIDVEWRSGTGRIEILRGDLWTASDPQGKGEPAFRRLAFRRDVAIRCFASEVEPQSRDILQSWEGVLMDSAREHDEEVRRSSSQEMRASRPVFDLADLVELESSPAPAKASSRGTDVTLPSVERVVPPRDSRPPEKDDGFDALCDQAIAALLAKDYRTATMLFAEAQTLRPDDARVNANLKRLSEIGYAAVVGSPDRRDP